MHDVFHCNRLRCSISGEQVASFRRMLPETFPFMTHAAAWGQYVLDVLALPGPSHSIFIVSADIQAAKGRRSALARTDDDL